MMLSQNPGHRVVLGSRVAVPIAGDFYAAATVQAVRNDVKGNEFVTVKFDDNNKGECPSSEIVGNGFKSIHDIKLHKDQKVYTTYNGREVSCLVEEHSGGFVQLSLLDSDERISKREGEVSLTESRYSPRLHDHNPDYRRLASVNASPGHGKKRPVSDSIEVPKPGRARKWSAEPTMDELMAAMVLSTLSSSPVFHNPKSPTAKKGSSPHSFGSSGVGSWGQDTQMSPIPAEPMVQSESQGVAADSESMPERTRSVIHHTHCIEHSPSSTGDPIEVDTSIGYNTSIPMDEDGADYSAPGGVVPPGHSTPAPFQSGSPRVLFHPAQGTSPSQNPTFLGKQGVILESVKEESTDGEEEKLPAGVTYYPQQRIFYIPSLIPSVQATRPEYMVHIRPIDTPPPLSAASDRQHTDASTFQHAQLPAGIRTPPPSNTCVYIGSPPTTFYTIPVMGASPLSTNLAFSSSQQRVPSPLAARNDRAATSTPPYQPSTLVTPSHSIRMPSLKSQAQPINIPGMKAFSWHTTGAPQSFSPKPSILTQRLHMHQAASPKMPFSMSPKTLPSGRKVRGDGKKCRKVYGMENRDMWCTACRWKKACQRFPD